jgi:hypothetical protein
MRQRRGQRHQDEGDLDGQIEADGFAEVLVQAAAFANGPSERGEVVVGKHHFCRLGATSAPPRPMATPIAAARSVGASFTPSPVTATTCPASPMAKLSIAQHKGRRRCQLRQGDDGPPGLPLGPGFDDGNGEDDHEDDGGIAQLTKDGVENSNDNQQQHQRLTKGLEQLLPQRLLVGGCDTIWPKLGKAPTHLRHRQPGGISG